MACLADITLSTSDAIASGLITAMFAGFLAFCYGFHVGFQFHKGLDEDEPAPTKQEPPPPATVVRSRNLEF